MNKKEIKALIIVIVFILLEGIGMCLMFNIFDIKYTSSLIAKVLIYTQFILALFAIYVNKKYFNNCGFEKLNIKEIKWFIPFAVLIIVLLISTIITAKWNENINYILVIKTMIMTLFVGIAEETVFRGIILKTFCKPNNIKRGIIISAIAFSMLHSVNILAGISIITMISQLIMTFLFGLAFACVAIKIRNIIPLIIYHWIWDFCIISSPLIASNIMLITSLGIILEIVIVIVFIKKSKKERKI